MPKLMIDDTVLAEYTDADLTTGSQKLAEHLAILLREWAVKRTQGALEG